MNNFPNNQSIKSRDIISSVTRGAQSSLITATDVVNSELS